LLWHKISTNLIGLNDLWVLWSSYVEVFGFPPVLGFAGVFSLLSFFLFWYHFCILSICLGAPLWLKIFFGGLQVWQFVRWVVLPRACRCLWGGVVEEHQERVGDIL